MIKTVSTPDAPAPLGHYAQAVIAGAFVFVSGQLAIDPESGQPQAGPIGEQTRMALKNVAALLQAAGSSVDRVVKTTVYVSDMSGFGEVNEAYAEFFGEHRPARAAVPTRDLPKGLGVEIEAVALA